MRTLESDAAEEFFDDRAEHSGFIDEMTKLGAEATKAGVLVDTAGILPTATATRVNVAGGEMTISDGPFDEPTPLAAYAIYDVNSREEVLEWTHRFMDLHRRAWPGWEGELEIRQAFGLQGPA